MTCGRGQRVRFLFSQPPAAGFLAGQQEFSAANPWLSAKRMDGVTHFPALQIPDARSSLSPGKPDFQLFYLPLITILKCGTVGRANRPRQATELGGSCVQPTGQAVTIGNEAPSPGLASKVPDGSVPATLA